MFMCARRIKKLTFGWPVVDMVVFFLVCENFRGRLDESFPHLCFFNFFFFFEAEIGLHSPTPLCRPGPVHSGLASLDDYE